MNGSEAYRFPIIIIGDCMCGKSTLLKCFANNEFCDSCHSTVGVDFFSKAIQIKHGQRVRLDMWDTAGEEMYRAQTKSYYRKAMGIFLAYDITCKRSFLRLGNWLDDAKNNTCKDAVFQVIGCKCDLENQREVSTKEGEEFAKEHGICFIETSSKEMLNVNTAFVMVAEAILKKIEIGEIEANKITPTDPLVQFDGKINTRFRKKECQLC